MQTSPLNTKTHWDNIYKKHTKKNWDYNFYRFHLKGKEVADWARHPNINTGNSGFKHISRPNGSTNRYRALAQFHLLVNIILV